MKIIVSNLHYIDFSSSDHTIAILAIDYFAMGIEHLYEKET